ncbi:autotransporter domain-containing protein [Moraxella sp. VT-16-12]|uniref:autotransporter domain-containing protein n=1 Tax=Moraxella sp. VT-16-12 TaxID=2014877 RepID=UPI0016453C49|nr:autotransporter domain-containing protein [Moraxella sp. VT-16-12]
MTKRSVVTKPFTAKNVIAKYRPLSLAVALLSMSSVATAQEFSQTIFFGDSLTDTGRLAQIGKNSLAAPIFSNAQQSFTTNPDTTWAGVLANAYGHTATANDGKTLTGTNYAVGGARTKEDVARVAPILGFTLFTIPSTQTQVDSYLKLTNNQADPKALYTVWTGANDLFEAANAKSPEQALGIITTAASHQATLVKQLGQAGANYILVPNIPDVGVTPSYVNDPAKSATATTAAKLYNQTLYKSLGNQGVNVIPANTFALLQEAVGNKAGFGFTNVNEPACQNLDTDLTSLACKQSDWQATSANANETYAFADGIHPSGRTHRILAQYYRSIIETPAYIGQIPQRLIYDGTATAKQLHRRLENLDRHQHSVWFDADVGGDKFITNADNKPSFMLGFDIPQTHGHVGAYLKYRNQEHQLGKNIHADISQVGLGLYRHYDKNQFRLKVSAGIDRLHIDTKRQLDWDGPARVHQAKGSGRRLHANLQGSHSINTGKATYRPYLGVGIQSVKVAELIENQPQLSTALHFHQQAQKSVQGEIGINWQYDINPTIQLIADVGHRYEFKDKTDPISTSLPSMLEYRQGFSTPVASIKRHSTHAYVGTKFNFGRASVSAGLNATHHNSTHDVGGFVGMQTSF